MVANTNIEIQQRLQSRADANRANNAEKYKLWVESHTPAEIYNANLARARLARMNVQSKARKIPDERMPKRPMNAYLTYVKEQWMTGDFSGAVENTGPELARGWKALPEEEKKVSFFCPASPPCRARVVNVSDSDMRTMRRRSSPSTAGVGMRFWGSRRKGPGERSIKVL